MTRLTDDALFRCPFVMMTEVGAAYFDPAEAQQLAAEARRIGLFVSDNDTWEDVFFRVMLDRIEPFQKKVKLHEDNIANLRKELGNLR